MFLLFTSGTGTDEIYETIRETRLSEPIVNRYGALSDCE
jgi:hypothetical protein